MAGRRGVSRRKFLESAAIGTGAIALGRHAALAERIGAAARPNPARSGIDHVVVVMMENRSFDHMLGWLPGADGKQAGLTYVDRAGIAHATHSLAPDYQGCAHPDPDHSYDGARVEYDGGACDGWLRAGSNDEYAIGYYEAGDAPFFARAATDWTACDRYFAAFMGPTFPNRMYQHAAETDRISNTLRAEHAADDLGSDRGGRPHRALLLSGCAVSRVVGREVRADRAPLSRVPARVRDGAASARVVRRSTVHRRADRNDER